MLSECPRQYVSSLVDAINLASFADRGCFPSEGGLLNQSVSFLELVAVLENESAKLQNERMRGEIDA